MFTYDLNYYIAKYKTPLKWGAILLVALIIIASVAYNIYLFELRKGKIAVPLRTVPADATVIIDGSEIHNTKTIYLQAGLHTVTTKKEGFTPLTQEYRIETYNSPALYIGLAPQSEAAKQWQKTHRRDYRELELLTVKQAHKYTAGFEARNPIVKELPIKDPYFTISYRNIEDKTIKLVIWGTSPRYREFALDYLRKKGYEPTDYIVEFKNFNNPLNKKGETNE